MSNLKDFIGGSGGALWWDEIYDTTLEVTVSQDWIVPTGVTECVIGICGGGGGALWATASGGGGGSGMTYHKVPLTPLSTIPIVIGAAGISGTPNTATDGGTTTFLSHSAIGGKKMYGNGAIDGSGEGMNGGGNGSSNGISGIYPREAVSITVSKVVAGNVVLKTISPAVGLGSSGGAGGGFDYENFGSGGAYTAPSAQDGICVIWYNS